MKCSICTLLLTSGCIHEISNSSVTKESFSEMYTTYSHLENPDRKRIKCVSLLVRVYKIEENLIEG